MARVLILEDEKLVARDIQSTLSNAGYETSLASSGEDALALAREERPDLALVDIRLAGTLDGIETASALRRELEIPVVYLTAHSDEDTLERAKATEPLGYLVKPFNETTLQTTVRMAVHKSGVEQRRHLEQKRLTSVLDQLTVGLVTTDRMGRVSMMNSRAQALTGWPAAEAVGKDLTQVLTLRDARKISITADLVSSALTGQESKPKGVLSLLSKSGTEMLIEQKISLIGDDQEQGAGVSLVFWPTDSTAGELTLPAKSAADSDPLTGLPSRARAITVIEATRKRQSNLFLTLFVLDRYYLLVRKYGTSTADEVLKSYCAYLAQQIDEKLQSKSVFRWSGPSFLAMFGPLDCLRTARREIGRIKLDREFELSARMALLSLSASASVFALDEQPPDILINEIDSFAATQVKHHQQY